MDALLIAGFVLAVLGLMAWLFTAAAVAYILYKYVYQPWLVVRRDLAALAEKVRQLDAASGNGRVSALDDAEVARREARLNARARAQHGTLTPP